MPPWVRAWSTAVVVEDGGLTWELGGWDTLSPEQPQVPVSMETAARCGREAGYSARAPCEWQSLNDAAGLPT
jgi:hypothetical protein